jgi:AAA+ superfamily predicted ATPase
MDYDLMNVQELKKECKKRSMKKYSLKTRKDLIFSLKCNDKLGYKLCFHEPGCSWERANEIDPNLSSVNSFENFMIHLKGIESTTNKKHKEKQSKETIYFEMGDLFSIFEKSTQNFEDNNSENMDANSFTINDDNHYDELHIKNIDLNALIELGNKYRIDFKNKYAFNYELLNKITPFLEEINSYIGWQDIKEKIVSIIIPILLNLDENNDLMHTVIWGPPGVGKTTLGLILSKIYSRCGLIKEANGKFNIFKKSDLIGEFLGQTAIKTQRAIDSSLGGVMFIDEAYSLGVMNSEGTNSAYARECIDTLNFNLTSNAGKFICIIAGYEDLLKKQFFSLNYGLERRFPILFSISDYSATELALIFKKKIQELNYLLQVDLPTLNNFIKSNYDSFKFYAGDIENLIPFIKRRHAIAIFGKGKDCRKKITIENIEDGFKDFMKNRQNETKNEDYLSMYS